MLIFFADAWNILRFRFQPLSHYRYNQATLFLAVLVLTVVNAGMLVPFFKLPTTSLLLMAAVITVLKLITLIYVMQVFLYYQGSPRLKLFSFVILSESLIAPLIVIQSVPELTTLGVAWQFWVLIVQFKAFMYFSGKRSFIVLIAYLIYFVVVFILTAMIISLCISSGWIDPQMVIKNLQDMNQTIPAP